MVSTILGGDGTVGLSEAVVRGANILKRTLP